MIDRKPSLHNPHTAIPAQTIHRTFAQGYRRMSSWPLHVVPFQMYVKHYIEFNHNKDPNTEEGFVYAWDALQSFCGCCSIFYL